MRILSKALFLWIPLVIGGCVPALHPELKSIYQQFDSDLEKVTSSDRGRLESRKAGEGEIYNSVWSFSRLRYPN